MRRLRFVCPDRTAVLAAGERQAVRRAGHPPAQVCVSGQDCSVSSR